MNRRRCRKSLALRKYATSACYLEISGSGSGRLKNLIAQSAQIKIRGSGDAQITAQADADVSISGSGDVELYGHPTMRRSEVSGSGTQVP